MSESPINRRGEPLHASRACAADSAHASAPLLLAIDDSKLIHRLLRARLRSERIEIHSALTGEDGARAADKLLPDVILLDVELPDVDGYSVLRRLKENTQTHDIPVILLAGSNDTAEKVRALEMGAIDFITKPFEMAELKARVRSAVQIRLFIKMLAERAHVDAVTALWNRAHFNERLKQLFAEAVRHKADLSLVFCDIDHFKSINDRFGHTFGDHVLKEFAAMLSSGRLEDTACRYGGEEFVILLPRTCAEQAFVLAERLRHALREKTWEGHPRLRVTASFGVSDTSRLPDRTPHDLIRSADAALYAAKQGGRDDVRIAPAVDNSLRLSA